ncbi:MAG: SpoIID/LytB domain-containing protein, partial [Clostridia bacterium]
VARTYTIYQINNNSSKHENADICDNYACCQAWISKEDRISKWNEEEAESNWNKIVEAVNSTSGKVITYDGKPINAFFIKQWRSDRKFNSCMGWNRFSIFKICRNSRRRGV